MSSGGSISDMINKINSNRSLLSSFRDNKKRYRNFKTVSKTNNYLNPKTDNFTNNETEISKTKTSPVDKDNSNIYIFVIIFCVIILAFILIYLS